MKAEFLRQCETAKQLPSAHARVQYLCALVRSVLQHASFALLEFWLEFGEADLDGDVRAQVARILVPSDGTPGDVIDALLPIMRGVWSSCATRWFESAPGTDGKGRQASLAIQTSKWVQYRNNRPAHGVPDQASTEQAEEWLAPYAEALIDGLSDLLPRSTPGSNKLELETVKGVLILDAIRAHEGKAIVIRDVQSKGGGWVVRYQVLDFANSPQAQYQLLDDTRLNLLFERTDRAFVGRIVRLGDDIWRPTVLVPLRQTSTFEGRRSEYDQLVQWYNDLDSRACLIHGDGGIGKTTLVLEFINDLLEGPAFEVSWRPALICFFSAKQTLWTAEGIQYLRGVTPAIAEAVRRLATVLETPLARKWYTAEPLEVVNFASQFVRRGRPQT
jgi:hypothetical protein